MFLVLNFVMLAFFDFDFTASGRSFSSSVLCLYWAKHTTSWLSSPLLFSKGWGNQTRGTLFMKDKVHHLLKSDTYPWLLRVITTHYVLRTRNNTQCCYTSVTVNIYTNPTIFWNINKHWLTHNSVKILRSIMSVVSSNQLVTHWHIWNKLKQTLRSLSRPVRLTPQESLHD